jgi:hypothetical protein
MLREPAKPKHAQPYPKDAATFGAAYGRACNALVGEAWGGVLQLAGVYMAMVAVTVVCWIFKEGWM